jgi:hypothetical protein
MNYGLMSNDGWDGLGLIGLGWFGLVLYKV